MEIKPYLIALRRRWWVLVSGILVAMCGIALYDAGSTPTYQSATRILIAQSSGSATGASANVQATQQLAKTYAEIIKSRPILEEAISQIGLATTPENLGTRTQVRIIPDTPIIQIIVSDTNPQRAARTADGLVQAFMAGVQGKQQASEQQAVQQTALRDVDAEVAQVRSKITDTSDRLAQARATVDANAEIQQLESRLSDMRQESRDIRQRRDDLANRIFQIRATPGGATESEIARLDGEIKRYEQDLKEADQRIAETSAQLSALRSANRPAATTADVQRLQDQLTVLQEQNRKLADARQALLLDTQRNAATATVVEEATVASQPARPRVKQDLLLAGILGLLLAAGAVVALAHFDDRLAEPDGFRRKFGMTPLGILGTVRHGNARVLTEAPPSDVSAYMDSLRLVQANLASEIRRRPTAIAVTSANDGEGKSTLAANLAILEAQSGRRVILVDGNLRAPRLHRIFGLSDETGLSTLLTDPDAETVDALQDASHGVRVLPSGPTAFDVAALLSAPRMATRIAELRDLADLVIFDTSAVSQVPDTRLYQEHLDGLVLVVDMRKTGVKALEALFATLRATSARVVGVVLNQTPQAWHGIHLPAIHVGTRRAVPAEPPALLPGSARDEEPIEAEA